MDNLPLLKKPSAEKRSYSLCRLNVRYSVQHYLTLRRWLVHCQQTNKRKCSTAVSGVCLVCTYYTCHADISAATSSTARGASVGVVSIQTAPSTVSAVASYSYDGVNLLRHTLRPGEATCTLYYGARKPGMRCV